MISWVKVPRWRWWLVLWPPALRRYIDETAKFHATRISVDQTAPIETLSAVFQTKAAEHTHQEEQ